MAFYLYNGCRLELLAEVFRTQVYEIPRQSPEEILQPETAAVMTKGVASWLDQFLAEHSEMSVNLDQPFILKLIQTILKQCFPEFARDQEASSPEGMRWKLFEFFSGPLPDYLPPPIRSYLDPAGDPTCRKRLQFSSRIAALFDRYAVHRPEQIHSWRDPVFRSKDPSEAWQAALFRELFGSLYSFDCAMQDFLDGKADRAKLSLRSRYSLFGVSTMPLKFLHFWEKLSEWTDVHLFYLNPSREYWTNAMSRKEAARKAADQKDYEAILNTNNPVLSANCGQGRAFFDQLLDLPFEADPALEDLLQQPYRAEGAPLRILPQFQQDIYDNFHRTEALSVRNDDESLVILNAHTRIRELEALHSRLIRILSSGENIRPQDILVMVPDINEYASGIRAVFDGGPLKGSWSIMDRSLEKSGTVIPAFRDLLDLRSGRLERSRVLGVLARPEIAGRFGITKQDHALLSLWFEKASIQWGADEQDRQEMCGISFPEFSWKKGLDRILFGFAVCSEDAFSSPVLPVDAAEGRNMEALGRFLEFYRKFQIFRSDCAVPRTIHDWMIRLHTAVEQFICPETPAARRERDLLLQGFSQLEKRTESCRAEIPFETVLDLLSDSWSNTDSQGPFLRGGITFCSMVPMRSIPRKVIAVLGLNDGVFPRKGEQENFSMLESSPLPTDPSRRLEDRYLFLETILAAREYLILSYLGQDPRDNSTIPPCVPLGEVLDTLQESFVFEDGSKEHFEVREKLRSFDPDYFHGTDKRLFSASVPDERLAEILQKQSSQEEPCSLYRILAKHPSGMKLPADIPFDELTAFFQDPASFWLEKNLGFRFSDSDSEADAEEELFQLDYLQKSRVNDFLLSPEVQNTDPEQQYQALVRAECLPVRSMGHGTFRKQLEDVRKFRQAADPLRKKQVRMPLDLQLDKIRITGYLPNVLESGTGQQFIQMRSFSGKRCVQLWLGHLVGSALQRNFTTEIVAKDGKLQQFSSVLPDIARACLNRIADLMEQGYRTILPFFPDVSMDAGLNPDTEKEDLLQKMRPSGRPGPALQESFPFRILYRVEDFQKDSELWEQFLHSAETFFREYNLEEVKGSN